MELTYDRTTLAVDDTATATVRARLTQSGTARIVLLDLGIPPGSAS